MLKRETPVSTTPVEVALRQHQADEDRVVRLRPNFAEEDDLRDVVGAELVEPLSDLFSTRDQIRLLMRSEVLGDFWNRQKAVEWLLHDLANLEQALRRRFDAT
jgi:hypothetical protein